MTPSDFFLFSKIKGTLNGHRLTSIEGIKSESLKELKSLSLNVRAILKIEFEKCLRPEI